MPDLLKLEPSEIRSKSFVLATRIINYMFNPDSDEKEYTIDDLDTISLYEEITSLKIFEEAFELVYTMLHISDKDMFEGDDYSFEITLSVGTCSRSFHDLLEPIIRVKKVATCIGNCWE